MIKKNVLIFSLSLYIVLIFVDFISYFYIILNPKNLYERFGTYLTEIATQQAFILKSQVETFYVLLNVYFIILHTVVLVTFIAFI